MESLFLLWWSRWQFLLNEETVNKTDRRRTASESHLDGVQVVRAMSKPKPPLGSFCRCVTMHRHFPHNRTGIDLIVADCIAAIMAHSALVDFNPVYH